MTLNLKNGIPKSVGIYSQNVILNSFCDFWQRSSSSQSLPTTSDYLNIDRYVFELSGSSISIARSTDTPLTAIPYSMALTGTNNGDQAFIFQRIESNDIRQYIGRRVTFSFYTKINSGSASGQIRIYSPDGGQDIWDTNLSATTDTLEESKNINLSKN